MGFSLIKIVDFAFRVSEQPIKSLIVKSTFLVFFILPLILRKKEIYVYYFLLSFPFFPFIGKRISLVNMYAIILTVVYFKDILNLDKEKKYYYKYPFIILFLTFIYTTFLAKYPGQAIEKTMFYLSYGGIFFALSAYLKSEENLKTFSKFILIIYFFCCFISLWQLMFGIESIRFSFGEYLPNTNIYGSVKRIPSVFMEPQGAGQYFSTMSILSMGIVTTLFRRPKFGVFTLIVGCIFLMLTVSRLAMLSSILGVVILMLFLLPMKKLISVSLFSFVIIVFLISSYQLIFPQGIRERFATHNQAQSFEIRNNYWSKSFPIFLNNPFGVGLGGYNRFDAAKKVHFPFNEMAKKAQEYTHFESSYLSLLYSLGCIGFGAFIWLILKYYKLGAHLIRIKKYPFSVYLISAMTVWVITSAISPQMEEFQPMVTFTILLAYMNAMYVFYEKNSKNQSMLLLNKEDG